MTLMWCSLTTRPLILYPNGQERTLHPRDLDFDALDTRFPPSIPARQIHDLKIDLVQTCCGYNVNSFDYIAPRDTLAKSAAEKGEWGIRDDGATRNPHTIDGLPTPIQEHADG